MNNFVIIVAGGSGSRMNSDIPKQFLILHNKPILMHTIEKFYHYDASMIIILVLPALQINYWKKLCTDYSFTINHQIVEGGETRFHSVKNGLEKITSKGVVGVHDGVRPLVSFDTLDRVYSLALTKKCVIPIIDVFESVREVDGDKSKAVNRDRYKLVQTPQVFDVDLLKECYKQNYTSAFTDDASVCENAGYEVHLALGNRENIKVTTPTDMIIADAFLRM